MDGDSIPDGLKLRYLGYAKKPRASEEIKTIIDSLDGDADNFMDSEKENNDLNNKMVVHLLQVEAEDLYKTYLERNIESYKCANFLWELCQAEV